MDVNEWICYEFSEYMHPHLNIPNSSTLSHTSGEENRKCKRAFIYLLDLNRSSWGNYECEIHTMRFEIAPLNPLYTAISIKVVHEQSGNVEYERERLLGIALKMH